MQFSKNVVILTLGVKVNSIIIFFFEDVTDFQSVFCERVVYVISCAVANANQLFCGCLTELEVIFTSYGYWDIHISPVCHLKVTSSCPTLSTNSITNMKKMFCLFL